MRKLLMASAALLTASGGMAFAQKDIANQLQGQYQAPYGAGPAANNNNNSWGIANTPTGSLAAGPLSTLRAPNINKVPAPGTLVIRLNGRVEVDMSANYTTANNGINPNGTPNGYKINPIAFSSYMRLYPGFDGRAANGLRYGAAVELRENNAPPVTTATAAAPNPSTYSTTQTVFVRRAFSYIASDNVGIVRFGQTDGVVGLFDPCIFSSQCWDAGVGNFNGGGFQNGAPSSVGGVPFVWLAQAGAEYGNTKIVYLSPQFFGLDVGVQYAPNQGNSFSSGCQQAGFACTAVTSGSDPTRWFNQVGVGARYQLNLGAVDVKAYGYYETAGKENLTTQPYLAPTPTGSAARFRYDNLSFYQAGLAVTAADITAAVSYIGGAVNGQLQMRPTGGAKESAFVGGLTYANGPITLGAELGLIDSQGDPRLTNISQRHEYEVAFGGAYRLAPGLQLVGEYMYIHRHQGAYDFQNQNVVGNTGVVSTRDAQGQGFLFATVLTW